MLSRINVGGHSIHYRVEGKGPPLVLLHGFLCDSRCWRTQLTGLSDVFQVVAWDAPGAGLSSDPQRPFGITEWATVLAEFLDSLGIGKVHLLGLSWGGMLAQELCRLYPSRVDHLVLADTYAGWKGSLSAEMVEKRLARCYRDSSRAARDVVRDWVPVDFFSQASAELTAEMAAVVADFHPLGFRLMADSLATTDTTAFLTDIKAPTLLVWGEDDRRSPPTVAEQFHKAIAGSRIAVIHRAGHVCNMEKPDEFNALVKGFLFAGE